MTKEEWKQVEEWWGTGVGHVSMEIDGYSIFLRNYADKEKMTLSVMVRKRLSRRIRSSG